MQPQPPQQYGQPNYGGVPIGEPKKRMNALLLPFIITVTLLFGAMGFGIWAFMSRQDYKNNVDPKIAAAVKIAQQNTSTAKDKEFVEKEKNPLREYKASQSAGNLSVVFPKTWSAFINEAAKGETVVDGYFHPGYVPGLESGTDFALRVRVISKPYDQQLKQFEAKSKTGKITVQPYSPPKMSEDVVGVRIDGEINPGQQDSMVILPLRDKTIEISTQSPRFVGDFDSIILANLQFVP